jgi:hypothetical protein
VSVSKVVKTVKIHFTLLRENIIKIVIGIPLIPNFCLKITCPVSLLTVKSRGQFCYFLIKAMIVFIGCTCSLQLLCLFLSALLNLF